MAMPVPLVSVVIVCMNRPDNLYPCLESLRTNTSVPYETIVVAYMFSQENLGKARADFPWVSFIESNEIRGFSENNNLALRQVKGKYCFILNDDTEMNEPVIDRLLHDFSLLPESAAIVCPRLLNADGSLQLCGRPPYPAYKYVLQQFHLYTEPKDDTVRRTPEFGNVYRTFNISGAAFLIRTDLFRSLGFFDEQYFFTPEDIALSTLANEKGYGVYVDAGVGITHKWRTTASEIMPATRPAAIRGSLLFWSSGGRLRYLLMALPVWCAEMLKLVKASVICALHPTDMGLVIRKTYRNNVRAVFSRKDTKTIFAECYSELLQS